MTDKINIISDMAFDGIDEDKSGQIEKNELGRTLMSVSKNMGITEPSESDKTAILAELDQDGDSRVSKDEFAFLIMKVVDKMY